LTWKQFIEALAWIVVLLITFNLVIVLLEATSTMMVIAGLIIAAVAGKFLFSWGKLIFDGFKEER
jgi:hypothetical protein